MIEVVEVRKSFADNDVLKGINASFHPGKANLIIGTSGSGKTVLMKSIVGLFGIDSGEVLYDGKDFHTMDTKAKKQIRTEIGMLFQGTALFDSLTVEENVIFPLNMFTDMSQEEKHERVNFCLERVNLVGKNHLFPGELSGGMKKRVGIARAIVMNPKYLFCDEPNSGLDPKTSIVIDQLIEEITEEYNITTVINTHDMNSVMEIGHNIIFLYEGNLHWQGSNEDVIHSDNQELDDFIFASNFLKKAKLVAQQGGK
jgi:phospholipid/cholesterol/gamma-HCH transport system ATP-binding protein